MKTKEPIVLQLHKTSTNRPNIIKTHQPLFQSLLFGGALLVLAQAAPAASVVNSFNYSFRTALTNAGLDSDARATAKGNVIRRGPKDIQRLTISASQLDAESTYHLVVVTGDSATVTAADEFVTNQRGGSTITYHKNPGNSRNALPDAADPLSNLIALGIHNADDAAVLGADLLSPDTFKYSVRREMDNPGFLEDANGVLALSGNPRTTRVSVSARDLTPLTSYQLWVNDVNVTTRTSDRRGKLNIAGPRDGLPRALDITSVALTDEGANIILLTTGLGIPGSLSTSKSRVELGAAEDFAVLAGSTVTSINATTVNGDLGVFAGSAVTGFPPGTVNGDIHAADDAAGLAQEALTIAYNDAAGRTLAPVSVAGNLGGKTLAPGLYKSTGSLEVSSGDLTLDAQGNSKAVFIFQIASTLTTTPGRQVILIGGAKAANVFWQVGTSATLDTTTVFVGTIMADQSITMNNLATLEGRALARIGGVSLNENTITIPAP